VVPADRKWFARLAVSELLREALEEIDPQWPEADFDVATERERLIAAGGVPEPEDEQRSKRPKKQSKGKKRKKGKKKSKKDK